MSLEDTIDVIIGGSRFDNTRAGHDSRSTAKDSEIVNVTLAVKWGIYIDPKTKEVRLLPYMSGCGIDLPLHFQGAIPARHVFQQIIERLTTSVSSQICVERLKAVGIDWKVQSFNKCCATICFVADLGRTTFYFASERQFCTRLMKLTCFDKIV